MCVPAEGAQKGSPYKTQPLSSMEPSPYEGKSGRKPNAETQASYFKLRLLECIAGLDRGFAANGFAAMQVESAALALTEQSEPISLSWTPGAGICLIACGVFSHSALNLCLFCITEIPAHAAPQHAGCHSLQQQTQACFCSSVILSTAGWCSSGHCMSQPSCDA